MSGHVQSPPESFREILQGDRFVYGAEVVATRGPATPYLPANLVPLARDLLEDPRIGWISITDNPGGAPILPPDWLAGLVSERRGRVVLHLTCKDMNRNGLETAAWRYAAEGFENILALTGDYPTTGFGGMAAPVFDHAGEIVGVIGVVGRQAGLDVTWDGPVAAGLREAAAKISARLGHKGKL